MRLIRKLDAFILKSYLLLFAGTFFICLFIFMMQFMWRYVEELIGKGLSWDVLGKFFYYSGLTLVPMSLPLAILLASLISFGNLGEKFELLSMKAAGVPLVRILQPVFCFVLLVCGGSFYFQNKIGPEATKQLATLIWSMKQKSPELEIPEGIFYNEIPGYNLFVEHKDPDTGMLYGVMIYNNTNSYEDAQIVLADSARLQSTADKMHLKLTLFNGERFRNMESQSGSMLRANVPYMRES
ncbi:MAG: LptF/LptG family permease, partial [Bacteroidaceae bacterium]|nr:LptF/LptG family permease [Bacteroidaceae bacterium]